MPAAVAVLAILTSVSMAACNDVFTYIKPDYFRRADNEECNICYGDYDCWTMNQARCEFYTATSQVLFEDKDPEESTNPELRARVDDMMMGLAEQANNLLASQECVPFVSQYTDCTKGKILKNNSCPGPTKNICLGCESCFCSAEGSWNCSSVQRCRHEEPLDMDHRALVVALETLKGDGTPSFRLKRSLSTTVEPKTHSMTLEEMAYWLYEAKPKQDVTTNTTEATSTIGSTESSIAVLTTVNADTSTSNPIEINNIEQDYFNLNDGVKNMTTQNNNQTQEKTLKTTDLLSNILEHDYMSLDDVNVKVEEFNEIQMANQFVHILKAIENENKQDERTTQTPEVTSKLFIDLLELARSKIETGNDFNVTDKKVTLQNDAEFIDFNSINDLDAINIMKRDVSQVTENYINITFAGQMNDTNTSKELKDGVYSPMNAINAIIEDKQKELEDLQHVREKLFDILNLNRSNDYVLLNKSTSVENGSNSYISFYNVQIVPQTEIDIKRNGYDLLDNYMKKLRRDVYVVIKDIVSIQKVTGPEDFPKQLKVLTRAIKHFMRNHTKSHRKSKSLSFDNIADFRRRQITDNVVKDFVKNVFINIIQLIDKNIRYSNALAPLSIKSRKILKRVIKHNKLDEFSVPALRINDPNYNMTNDLKSVAASWQDMTVKISNSSPWDRLHHMKLLHLVLGADIGKMKDALALIDFAHSRRMFAIEDEVDSDELLRINKILRSLYDKIKDITKSSVLNQPGSKVVKIFTITKKNKKETFLKHIRNLLKSSKTDIANLLRKKVPKSVIVKELAKQKLNDITKKKLIEYENAMHKWQNNLDITRKKRSFGKLTNILPKYLRGKVSTGMNSTKHKNKLKPKHSERKKIKKNSKKNAPAATTKRKNQTVKLNNNIRHTFRQEGKKINKKNTTVAAKPNILSNKTNKTKL